MTDHETTLVTGASGHVGAALVDQLAAAGHRVRAMTRRPHALAVPDGVEVVAGDADDPASLDAAFAGVDRAFLLSAENVTTSAGPTHVPALVDAAVRSGTTRHLVLLSVHSGGEGTDVLAGWWRCVERAVVDSGLTWTLLRPGRFMSNALAWAPQIARGDEIAVPFAHRPAASIDPADIAAVAASALTDIRRHAGAVHQLSGPAAMTPAEELAEVATLLGRPLRAVEPPLEQVRAGMARHGMPEEVIDAVLARTLESVEGAEVLPTVEQVLARPAHPFATWAQAHRDALAGSPS